MSESHKPDSAEEPLGPAVRRNRSAAARRAARLRKANREARIIGLLNRGVSVAEIAAREGLSLKRMRNLVREILAKCMPQPPAEFLALQVSRLNEALLVAVDRELERRSLCGSRRRLKTRSRSKSQLAGRLGTPKEGAPKGQRLTDLILRSPQSGRLEGWSSPELRWRPLERPSRPLRGALRREVVGSYND